jgi:peptide/nickel transport system substrate-binding protein
MAHFSPNDRFYHGFRYHLIGTATAVAILGGLAACTSPSTTAPSTTSPATTSPATTSPAAGASGSATASGTSGAAGSTGGSITIGLAGAPDALDPTTGSTFDGRTVFANMCQKLYDINAQLNIVPQLAASLPAVSADGKTYTIQLRQGIQFNDGTPFNAAAVQTTLEHYLTDPQSARAVELKGLTSVTVSGPDTVVLHLSKPFAPLTSILADRSGMILSPAQLAKLGSNFAQDPVCVGPFEFSSRPSLDTIILKKSPYYYGKAGVHLSQITFEVVTDQSTMAADLASGQIQLGEQIAPQDVPSLKNNPAVTLEAQNSLGYEGIDINTGNVNGSLKPYGTANNPFATHPTLREAFELSLNRAQLTKVAFDGLYAPTCSPIPSGSPWAVNVPCPAQNVAEAKQLIAATGLKTPIHVSLMIANDPLDQQIGSIIQSMAQQAGFAVSLQPLEFTTSLSKAAAGQFEMYVVGWSGRIDPDQNIFSDWYPQSALNYTGAQYPALDSLLVQARESTSDSQRKSLYAQAVQLMHAELNLIYLWDPTYYLGISKTVTGVQYFPDSLIRLENASVS